MIVANPCLRISIRIVCTLCCCLLPILPAFAAEHVVTGNADSGAGSLRQAIADAAEDDAITFNLASGNETITILSELAITKSLTIDGANTGNANPVTVQVTTPGASAFRVFHISGADKTVTLDNMTIKGGDISGNGDTENGYGGAVYISAGTVNINNSVISDSKSYKGGGIYATGCTVHLDQTDLKGNTATYQVGGLFVDLSTATMTDCTVSQNVTQYSASGVFAQNSNLSVDACTINNNTGIQSGHGIYTIVNAELSTSSVDLVIRRSTICNNTAGNSGGGGVAAYGQTFKAIYSTIENCTITGNTATNYGRGVYFYQNIGTPRSTMTVRNTIIAGNSDEDYYYVGYGTLYDMGYNIVYVQNGDTTGAGKTFTNSTNIYSGMENLFGSGKATQTLADNGGPTQTLALESGSIALDAIPYADSGNGVWNGATTSGGNYYDQRGAEIEPESPISIGAYSELPPPEMGLKQGINPIADGGAHDFGSRVTGTDTDVVFTIENTGTSNLTFTTPLSVGGADSDQFSIRSQPTSPVAASGSTDFTVRFSPTSTGDKTAVISIDNNDDDENPYDLTLNGKGTAPEITLKQGINPIADGGAHDFGSRVTGTDTDVVFTIENTGTSNLTFTTPLSVGGADSDQFSIRSQPTSPVAGSGSTDFTVRFSPTSAGDKTAVISIDNNDDDENPYDLTLNGKGTAPEIALKQGINPITDGGAHDFGSRVTGTDMDVVFTIENTGTSNLTFTTPLSVGGADSDQFSIRSQPTSPVAASGSTDFTVRFSPTSAGDKTAVISIDNNDDDENPYDLTLNGDSDDNDGVAPGTEANVPTPGGGTGDGNGDGIPDQDQVDVTSLPTHDDSGYVTFDCRANEGISLQNVSAFSPTAVGAPSNLQMPFGAFSFEVHGVTAGQKVTIDVFTPRDASITGYFDENKNTGAWEDIATTVDHDTVPDKTKITIQLTEGGPYDTDAVDTTITDPSGPCAPDTSSGAEAYSRISHVPTLTTRGAAVLMILAAVAALSRLRRRRTS